MSSSGPPGWSRSVSNHSVCEFFIDIKAANQEHCRKVDTSHNDQRDLRAVGRIAMELMQKYVKDDDAVGVEDLNRWPSTSKAVIFLSETTSAVSVNELIQVGRHVCSNDRLTSLASSHPFSLAGGRAEVDGGIGRGISLPRIQIFPLGPRFTLFPVHQTDSWELSSHSLIQFGDPKCSTFWKLLNLARMRTGCVQIHPIIEQSTSGCSS